MEETNNYKFIYKRQSPFFVYTISGAIILFAIIRILNSPLSSIFLGLCSTAILGYRSGITIDFMNRRYKYFHALGPQEFGDWEEMGALKYISVFGASYSNTVRGVGAASASVKQKLIEVNLITENNQRINVCTLKDVDSAFEQANILAKELSLKIYDATTREAKWLD